MNKRVLFLITAVVCALISAPRPAHAGAVKDCADWLLEQARPFIPKNAFTQDRIGTVFAEVNSFWEQEFKQRGWNFAPPKLILYTSRTRTACGLIWYEEGPIYCYADSTIYIDRNFFRSHKDRVGRPSEGLLNYVIAHEMGHHLQNLRGVFMASGLFDSGKSVDVAQEKEFRILLEFQADCLAGVAIGHRISRGQTSRFNKRVALSTAERTGDDSQARIALAQGRQVTLEYIHGSGRDRKMWLQKGLTSRSMESCEPFAAPVLP